HPFLSTINFVPVSDFLAFYKLASKIRKEFASAPSQFRAISEEVGNLRNTIEGVEGVLPNQELTSKQKTELSEIVCGCRSALEELEKTLDKYGELGPGPVTVEKWTKRVWKKLKWEPDDIRELRNRIVSNVTFLNAFNGRLTREGVDKLVCHQDNQERQAIIDWLSPTDYATQQSDFMSKRYEGTGLWFLTSSEFQKWISRSKQTMFCSGIPGAGKTMIASIVIDHLWTEFNDADVGIAFLYCNYQRQEEQNAVALLSSLLKQFSQEQPSVPVDLKNLYGRHVDKRTRPLFDEIVRVLRSTVQLFSRVFIIIDALDECHVSNEERNRFLEELFNLQAQTKVNIFATSRPVPEIELQFEACISKTIRAEDADVLKYINGRIPNLRPRIFKDSELVQTIREEVVRAVDGMFLLAQLHMDSLVSKPTRGDIKLALRNLPHGIGGVDAMYEQAMKRINGQEEELRTLAMKVLSWVTHAKRPLRAAELQHACAVEIGATELDTDFIPDVEDMVSACAGLVTVDEKSQIIRWIHYTTQEYFGRAWASLIPNAQLDIVKVCVTYLSFDVFLTGLCSTKEELEARLEHNILYYYAARNWGYHAYATSMEAEKIVLNFLKNEAKLSASCQVMLYNGFSIRKKPDAMRALHVAAYFGLREATLALLEPGHNPNSKETFNRKALLRVGIDVNLADNYNGWTALSWAIEKEHEAVVKLLLAVDGIDVNSTDGYKGMPALLQAVKKRNMAIVKLLLAMDSIDVNLKDEDGQTALLWAIRMGHEAVVKLLIAIDGIDVNAKGRDGQTALSWAIEMGHEAVVKLLLAVDGIDVNSMDGYKGIPALLRAVRKRNMAIVKLLLAMNSIDVNLKDEDGRTALFSGIIMGNEAVVKLLLATDGVDVNSKNRFS
ncbi:hypothetical protein AOQ84DRAFT_382728, partial [Glonium stellatum]